MAVAVEDVVQVLARVVGVAELRDRVLLGVEGVRVAGAAVGGRQVGVAQQALDLVAVLGSMFFVVGDVDK